MNILLSLLIYNPIEAYTLVLLCDIITGSRTEFNRKLFPYLFVYSDINFLIQCVPYIRYGCVGYTVLNVIAAYIIMPIILKKFYNLALHNSITWMQSFIAMFISGIFAIAIPIICDILFNIKTIFYNYNIFHEFMVNFAIFSLQILLYKIILLKRVYYEKHCKVYRRNND